MKKEKTKKGRNKEETSSRKKDKNNNTRYKEILAIFFLVILIMLSLTLTYLKFFSSYVINNDNIKEVPVNDSSSQAIHNALKTIVDNFNKSENVKKYQLENNTKLTATANNYSIFVTHSKDKKNTYEFTYNDLCLTIKVKNDNQNEFNEVYKFLIESVQKRINNYENISEIVDDFLLNNINYVGLDKKTYGEIIEYKINITEKLKKKMTS